MSHADDLIALADKVLIKNYRQQPVVLARGQGVELWDVDGRRYLDMTSGIAVCCLGHAHPALTRAIAEQAGRLIHTSNLWFAEETIRAAAAITERCFADRVFFCNSGAEANEAALKLARRWQHLVAGAPERNTIVSTHGSFHGRTMATVAVTGQEKYRADFGPLVEPVRMVPFVDLDAAAALLEQRTACAFLVEPIQAEGGIVVPPPGYFAGLRALCDATGTLLIFDEVQTGVGRTGRWFGHQHDGVTPDVMTLAKGLAGGVPIGAVAASDKAAAGLAVRDGGVVPHASTFGGGPLACAAARTVLETIDADGILANVERVGEHLHGALTALVDRFPGRCVDARGRGLLRGLALDRAAAPIVGKCRDQGVLLSVAGANVIRFAPALITTTAHIDEAVAALTTALAVELA
ncbi:MAG TPA: aspartate aminotransferase family protein [Kofleriaceae bacterium]|nr:aspartate aminotransferase family protein [Kofleriaceae bacterium]